MKHIWRLAVLITALALVVPSVTAGQSEYPIQSLSQARPCREADVVVPGYLHSSRHGAWVTDGPGTGKKGLSVHFALANKAVGGKVQAYAFRPQDYLHKLFSAVFIGRLRCNDEGHPFLELRDAKEINVSPVKDAVPNNSFKPNPLRGSA